MKRGWHVVHLAGLALLMSACSLLPTPDDSDDVTTWTGTITLNSSSVPAPYSWSKTAVIDGTKAELTVSWAPEKVNTSHTKESWKTTLTNEQLVEVNSAIDSIKGSSSQVNPGACWTTLELESSQGEQVNVTLTPDDARYARATDLFDNLAGDENPQLPEHSYDC